MGPDDALRPVRALRELLGPAPAGLGPPLATALADVGPQRLQDALAALGISPTPDPPSALAALRDFLREEWRAAAALDAAPAGVRDVLDRLAWGPPVGELPTAPRLVPPSEARTPVEWLLSRCLLAAAGPQVVLPREVGLHLRGGRVHRAPAPEPPALDATARDAAAVDRTCGQAAFTVVRHVEELLEAWSIDGPPVLRSGGLGVRELRRAAGLLDIDEPTAAFLAELCYAAGLVGPSAEADAWLPTPAYDGWRAHDAPQRWYTLAAAWLDTTRVAALAGGGTSATGRWRRWARISTARWHPRYAAPSCSSSRRCRAAAARRRPPSRTGCAGTARAAPACVATWSAGRCARPSCWA
jgi:hypothetical protein